jgi:hypothetical protein
MVVLALASVPASADIAGTSAARGVGPVLGIGMDPEQVHIGLRFGAGQLSNRLDLRPGVEAGFGDHITRGSFLVDALYRFRDRWDVWQPYAGGGISLGILGHDHDHDPDFGDDDTEVEPGLNIIGGVSKAVRGDDLFQTELRIGIGEAPDLGISVGWLFR